MITREWLIDNFTYNPETGHMSHKPKPIEEYKGMSKARVLKRLRGDRAEVFRERKSGCSYYAIVKGDKSMYAHRAAFLMHHGYAPKIIDHINGNPFDNRLCNLRESSSLQNNRNCSLQKNNKTGRVGVRLVKGRYYAAIGVGGKNKHIGIFDAFEDACKAREQAELKYGYEPNHGKRNSQQSDPSLERIAMVEVGTKRRVK
ncbi:MAG: HNH endonuclease signature motif containing protein [Glaciecola sp.]